MTSKNLENLADIGKLKRERTGQPEFDGLVQSGRRRLADARITGLSLEGHLDVEDGLVNELIVMVELLAKKVEALGELT